MDPHLAALTKRILHPDILLPILSLVPTTHLPPVLRSSRFLHDIAGPLLYADLSLSLSSTALSPHISPLGSLFPPNASPADLRATLHDAPSRKRLLLQRARTLRVGYHSHHVLPSAVRHLALDLERVEVLHLEGTAICHHAPCPVLRGLRPRVVVLETMCLEIPTIRGVTSLERTEHVLVRLRPTSLGMLPHISPSPAFPSSSGSGSAPGQCDTNTDTDGLSLVQTRGGRLTILLTPLTHIDGAGHTAASPWRPARQPRCGGAYSTPKPSFCDFAMHVARASAGWREVVLVGAEMVDEAWVRGCVKEWRWEREEGDGVGRVRMVRKTVGEVVREEVEEQLALLKEEEGMDGDGAAPMGRRVDMRFEGYADWRAGRDGYLDDGPELGMGYKGKGRAVWATEERPRLVKASSV